MTANEKMVSVNDFSEKLLQVVGILNAVSSCLSYSTGDDPMTDEMLEQLYYCLQGAVDMLESLDEQLIPLAFHPVLTEGQQT